MRSYDGGGPFKGNGAMPAGNSGGDPGEMDMRWACRTPWAIGSPAVLVGILALIVVGTWNAAGFAQRAANETGASAGNQAGDQPNDPGPLATDLSPELNSKQIRAAMRKVADWELKRVQSQAPSRAWDFGALDIGLMAASRTLHDPRYSRYVASVGDHFGWKLERTIYPANDFAIAQAWIEVYRSSHNEAADCAAAESIRRCGGAAERS